MCWVHTSCDLHTNHHLLPTTSLRGPAKNNKRLIYVTVSEDPRWLSRVVLAQGHHFRGCHQDNGRDRIFNSLPGAEGSVCKTAHSHGSWPEASVSQYVPLSIAHRGSWLSPEQVTQERKSKAEKPQCHGQAWEVTLYSVGHTVQSGCSAGGDHTRARTPEEGIVENHLESWLSQQLCFPPSNTVTSLLHGCSCQASEGQARGVSLRLIL